MTNFACHTAEDDRRARFDVDGMRQSLDAALAQVARLQDSLSHAEASYRAMACSWESDKATADLCEAENARLKDAAKGMGMVSELADMDEVAVLVVGLHAEIARLRALVAVGREMADALAGGPQAPWTATWAARKWHYLDTEAGP